MKHCIINFITLLTFAFLIISCQKNNNTRRTGMFLNLNSHLSNYISSPIKKAPKTIWKFKTNDQIISSQIVVDGYVYAISDK